MCEVGPQCTATALCIFFSRAGLVVFAWVAFDKASPPRDALARLPLKDGHSTTEGCQWALNRCHRRRQLPLIYDDSLFVQLTVPSGQACSRPAISLRISSRWWALLCVPTWASIDLFTSFAAFSIDAFIHFLSICLFISRPCLAFSVSFPIGSIRPLTCKYFLFFPLSLSLTVHSRVWQSSTIALRCIPRRALWSICHLPLYRWFELVCQPLMDLSTSGQSRQVPLAPLIWRHLLFGFTSVATAFCFSLSHANSLIYSQSTTKNTSTFAFSLFLLKCS